MTLVARQHDTQRGVPHLRVGQTQFSEALKAKLQRVGTPARWLPGSWEWDFPLTPAAVIALAKVAHDASESIEWRDGLREYAEQHVQQATHEHTVRLAIERIIQDGTPLEGYITRVEKADGTPIPPLRHQQVGWHWSQRSSGLLLAWEPGTGKTRAAADASGGWYRHSLIRQMQAAFIQGRPGVDGGVLIVCPKTMLRTWQEELALWQNANGLIIMGSAARKSQLAGSPAHYHLINYEALKYVEHNRYDGIIADESHRCGRSSMQSSFVLGIAQRARRKLGLTGTPVTNSLESVFYQMLIIDGGRSLGASKTAFLEKYFNTTVVRGGFTKHDPKDDAAVRIAEAMAESTYFVKKDEVLDLPEKTHTPIYLPMTDEQQRYYTQIKNEAITYIQDATVTVEQASAKAAKLLQICQGFALTDDGEGRHFSDAKTTTLVDLLTDTLAQRKVVVFAFFQYEIKRLADMLTQRGISFVRVDGTITSQRDRDAAMYAWNNDPRIHVYIRQISMSEGVTLLANESGVPCSDAIYLTLSYRLVDWIQSQDRIHRIGQNFKCSYTYLLTDTGVDKRVYGVLQDKNLTSELVKKTGKDFYLSLLQG